MFFSTRPAGSIEMRAAQRAGEIRVLAPVDVRRIGVFEDHRNRTVRRHAQHAIADDAGDPHVAFGVEGKPVRIGAAAERRHDFLAGSEPSGRTRKRDIRRANVSLT